MSVVKSDKDILHETMQRSFCSLRGGANQLRSDGLTRLGDRIRQFQLKIMWIPGSAVIMATRNYFLKFDYNQFNQENLFRIVSKFGNPKKLSILYVSTYAPNHTRTEVLLELVKKNEIKVAKVLVGNSNLKYLRAIYNLVKCQKNHDLVFVAFRGQEILPFIKLFTRKPIIFDSFVSVYDTLCFDRKIFTPKSFVGKFLKWYDKFLCKISDIVLVDTKSHKEYFEKEFGAENIDYLYVGCNETLFRPLKVGKKEGEFTVFWYGSANPLQGVDIILRSAKLLEDKEVFFRLVGPVRKRYFQLIMDLQPKNVEFVDFIPYEKLPVEIGKSDVCLGGHFGNRDKAKRVIASKTFQFLACKKPTIVGDNPANKELFRDEGLVRFVEMNNPEGLAETILEVKVR